MVINLHKDNFALYQRIHYWARENVLKPEACVKCGGISKLELSNNSGKYSLDVRDWEWVCRSCHAKKDKWNKKAGPYSRERMEKVRAGLRGKPSWNHGLKASEETRRRLSLSHLGQKAWNRGIPMSKETKNKLSASLRGQFTAGRVPWNRDLKKVLTSR